MYAVNLMRKEIEQLRRSIANRDEESEELKKEIKELRTQLSKVNEMLTSNLTDNCSFKHLTTAFSLFQTSLTD